MAGKTIKVMHEKMHEMDWSAKGEEEGHGDVTQATLPGTLRGASSNIAEAPSGNTEVPGVGPRGSQEGRGVR